MIVNIDNNLDGINRTKGGWIKTITRLDKDYKNGYSLVGEFLPVSSGNIDLEEGVLYLDCSMRGSRRIKKDYHLFKLIEGNIFIIQTVENGGKDWAMSLWESVEKELNIKENPVEVIIKQINRLSNEDFFELCKELGTKNKRYQKFMVLYMGRFLDEYNNNSEGYDKDVEYLKENGFI